MAFFARTFVLTGLPQRLSDAYGDGVGVVNSTHDIGYRQLLFQADPINANDVFIGDSAAVAEGNAGFHLEGGAAPWMAHISLGPFEAGPLHLSQIWALGTAGQHIHIAGVPF